MGYTKTQADASRVYFEDSGKSHSAIEVITAATTLTGEDSGKTLILGVATGVAIALPAVTAAKGFKLKVITGLSFGTTAFTVVATTAVIQGGVIVNSTFVPAVNETTITFAHAADTVGDYIDLECDGTNWYVSGVGAAAGAITFA